MSAAHSRPGRRLATLPESARTLAAASELGGFRPAQPRMEEYSSDGPVDLRTLGGSFGSFGGFHASPEFPRLTYWKGMT